MSLALPLKVKVWACTGEMSLWLCCSAQSPLSKSSSLSTCLKIRKPGRCWGWDVILAEPESLCPSANPLCPCISFWLARKPTAELDHCKTSSASRCGVFPLVLKIQSFQNNCWKSRTYRCQSPAHAVCESFILWSHRTKRSS